MPTPAERARAALARGDLIAAYDAAVSAIAEGDGSEDVRHQQVLALARMGDTARAMELFDSYALGRSADPHKRALGARLLKDKALSLPPGETRLAALCDAFEAYHRIFRESGDSFPGINAATLALLSGREEEAARIAAALLEDPAVAEARDFYLAVTRAEALLVLGRAEAAAEALAAPAVQASPDHGARSTSRRQLAMIADHLGLGEADRAGLLAALAPPAVVHYAGHMFAADPAVEAALGGAIESLLAEENAGFGYGSLACGSDILFAEALLARGAELHVILPFAEEDFLAQSVLPGGDAWLPRYRACLAAAASVTQATAIPFFGDADQYGYASRMAMGLARLRAEHLRSEPVQAVVWDGAAVAGPAGT
nr:adenylate cyclase [Pseudomonadota bacterium]